MSINLIVITITTFPVIKKMLSKNIFINVFYFKFFLRIRLNSFLGLNILVNKIIFNFKSISHNYYNASQRIL